MWSKENLKKMGVTLAIVMIGLAVHQAVVAPAIAKTIADIKAKKAPKVSAPSTK